MTLFVGLGNPGADYAGNRHNIGFMAVDAIARVHSFGPWRRKFQGHYAEGQLRGERVWLLKPETYMNESGRSVAEMARFFKVALADITVFYDELDLAAGKLKVRTGGGAAGHNGIRSIMAHLGEGFRRVRLGIGHPGHKDKVTGHVLSDFHKADSLWLEPLLDAVATECAWLVDGEEARFMSEVALRLQPEKIVRKEG
jgi:peptidyl-tRNA hydrolase, PTH1 family